MADLIERLRGKGRILFNLGDGSPTFVADPDCQEAATEIERLTEANAALMTERASLIGTKREQIERLTADRDNLEQSFVGVCDELGCERDNEAALVAVHKLKEQVTGLRAKLAQYEQSPVVGRVCDDFIQDPCGSAYCHNCGKRRHKHTISRPQH